MCQCPITCYNWIKNSFTYPFTHGLENPEIHKPTIITSSSIKIDPRLGLPFLNAVMSYTHMVPGWLTYKYLMFPSLFMTANINNRVGANFLHCAEGSCLEIFSVFYAVWLLVDVNIVDDYFLVLCNAALPFCWPSTCLASLGNNFKIDMLQLYNMYNQWTVQTLSM